MKKAFTWLLEHLEQIVNALVLIGGLVGAGLLWGTTVLSTQPLVYLRAGAIVSFLLAIFALAAVWRKKGAPAKGLFSVIAAVWLFIGGFIFFTSPPPPHWEMVRPPYEKRLDVPLSLVRDEILPPGYPGHAQFRELLRKERNGQTLEVDFLLYLTNEFARNRLPARIRVKPNEEFAIAAYTFKPKGTVGDWERISSGFSHVGKEIRLPSITDGTAKLRIALVVFPLTTTAASKVSSEPIPLRDIIGFD